MRRIGLGGGALILVGSLMFPVSGDPALAIAGPIPRFGWSIIYWDSQQNTVGESVQSMIDGKSFTYWHTAYTPSAPSHPHEVQIDLGIEYTVEGFLALPRADSANGRIGNWAFYVSNNPDDWGSPAGTGTFPDSAAEQQATFAPKDGRYVRLVALSEAGNRGPWTSLAEFNVLGFTTNVAAAAVQGNTVTWQPATDSIPGSPSCSIVSGSGVPSGIEGRAGVPGGCGPGTFDTSGLGLGVYQFDYRMTAGSSVTGTVSVTVREPIEVWDTAWSLPLNGTPADVRTYLDHLRDEGFSGTWISIVPPYFQDGMAGLNYAGQAMESFTDPNPGYLAHIDYILDQAANRGLTVGLVVAWAADYTGTRPGIVMHPPPALDDWFDPSDPGHDQKAFDYGALLGERWKGHPGLFAWVMGGDYWEPNTENLTEATWTNITAGLRSVGATGTVTYHSGGYPESWHNFSPDPWVDSLSPETGHCMNPQESQSVLNNLVRSYGKDVISAEMRYEGEDVDWCEVPFGLIGAAEIADDARAVLASGADGYVYGNRTRWPWSPGSLASLGSPGEQAMLAVLTKSDASPPPPPPQPSNDSVGLFNPQSGKWHLRVSPSVTNSFFFGTPGDTPLLGDWNGDGIDTVAMFRPDTGKIYLRNSNWFGPTETEFFFGMGGDIPLAGDWDGDGYDTFAVYRPTRGAVYISNELGTAPADFSYFFGEPGDRPFSGDFDGDGKDTVGLYRPGTGLVYLLNEHVTKPQADMTFYYGTNSDRAVFGDWDGDGDDTVGIFRPSNAIFYLSNDNQTQPADIPPFQMGQGSWLPVAGHLG